MTASTASLQLVDPPPIRLVTWNMRGGQHSHKAPAIGERGFDVAVFPETAMPAPSAWSKQVDWFGDNPNKGVAVLARPPYSIRRLPEASDVPQFVVPYAVEGPVCFTLFAVWTKARERARRYVRAVAQAIDLYDDLISRSPVVMMGDFNSNAAWDAKYPSAENHSSVVARLDRYDMTSAYHAGRNCKHGEEPDPTFYLHGKVDKPFHIDYVFIPKTWAAGSVSAAVGTFDATLSDHCPLVVTVNVTHTSPANAP